MDRVDLMVAPAQRGHQPAHGSGEWLAGARCRATRGSEIKHQHGALGGGGCKRSHLSSLCRGRAGHSQVLRGSWAGDATASEASEALLQALSTYTEVVV